jgi:hypothetical protein
MIKVSEIQKKIFKKKKNISEFVFKIENWKLKKMFIFLKKSEIFEIFKLIALLKFLLNFGHLFSKKISRAIVHCKKTGSLQI